MTPPRPHKRQCTMADKMAAQPEDALRNKLTACDSIVRYTRGVNDLAVASRTALDKDVLSEAARCVYASAAIDTHQATNTVLDRYIPAELSNLVSTALTEAVDAENNRARSGRAAHASNDRYESIRDRGAQLSIVLSRTIVVSLLMESSPLAASTTDKFRDSSSEARASISKARADCVAVFGSVRAAQDEATKACAAHTRACWVAIGKTAALQALTDAALQALTDAGLSEARRGVCANTLVAARLEANSPVGDKLSQAAALAIAARTESDRAHAEHAVLVKSTHDLADRVSADLEALAAATQAVAAARAALPAHTDP